MNDFLELTQGLIEKQDFEPTNIFEDLPKGHYTVQVVNTEKRTSQNGNDYIGVTLEVCDGDLTGRKIFDNLFFTMKTAENTIKKIYKIAQMMNIPAETFNDVNDIVEFVKKFNTKNFEVEYDAEAFIKVHYTNYLG